MATIVTRSGKGATLSHNEMDANFTNLNNDKLENDVNVMLKLKKGADIASNSTLNLGADGNYFNVTGTTTITSISTTGKVGTTIKLQFDTALTLTHNATDLILPGGANITTATGDHAEFIEYLSGKFRCVNYFKANGASLGREPATLAEIRTGTDNSKVVTPLGVNNTILGMGQSWQDLTSSRSVGVTYTNTTGRPIEIFVSVSLANTGTQTQIQTEGVTVAMITGPGAGTYAYELRGVIRNGENYIVIGGSPTLVAWSELR